MSEATTQAFLKTFAPSVRIYTPETQNVGCPYCPDGYVQITAMHKPEGGLEIPGFKDPHKCVSCGRFFKLVPVVQVKGAAIQGE